MVHFIILIKKVLYLLHNLGLKITCKPFILGGPQMHHSSVQGVSDPASSVAGVAGHPGAHSHPETSFFASSDAASRYYQMHYESAASQGNFRNSFFAIYAKH